MFFATVAGFRVFCDGSGGRCFLQRWWVFFASVGCVFCVGGAFCDGNPCFCDGWRGPPAVLFSVAGGVFCDDSPCFLRRLVRTPRGALFCGRSVFCVGKS